MPRKKATRKKAASKKPTYDNTNRGAFWNNNQKLSDKHPDYTGTVDVEGIMYLLSGWNVDSANPKAPCVSIALTLKQEKSHG